MKILSLLARGVKRVGRDLWKMIAELGVHQAYLTNEFTKGDAAMRGGDPKPEEEKRDFTES